MLFTLTALKILDNGIWCNRAAKNKTLDHKRFSCTRMTFCLSLMVTDALVWYSSILKFKSMKPNLNILPQLLPVIWWFISQQVWLSAHKSLVHNIRISQASVATCSRCRV